MENNYVSRYELERVVFHYLQDQNYLRAALSFCEESAMLKSLISHVKKGNKLFSFYPTLDRYFRELAQIRMILKNFNEELPDNLKCESNEPTLAILSNILTHYSIRANPTHYPLTELLNQESGDKTTGNIEIPKKNSNSDKACQTNITKPFRLSNNSFSPGSASSKCGKWFITLDSSKSTEENVCYHFALNMLYSLEQFSKDEPMGITVERVEDARVEKSAKISRKIQTQQVFNINQNIKTSGLAKKNQTVQTAESLEQAKLAANLPSTDETGYVTGNRQITQLKNVTSATVQSVCSISTTISPYNNHSKQHSITNATNNINTEELPENQISYSAIEHFISPSIKPTINKNNRSDDIASSLALKSAYQNLPVRSSEQLRTSGDLELAKNFTETDLVKELNKNNLKLQISSRKQKQEEGFCKLKDHDQQQKSLTDLQVQQTKNGNMPCKSTIQVETNESKGTSNDDRLLNEASLYGLSTPQKKSRHMRVLCFSPKSVTSTTSEEIIQSQKEKYFQKLELSCKKFKMQVALEQHNNITESSSVHTTATKVSTQVAEKAETVALKSGEEDHHMKLWREMRATRRNSIDVIMRDLIFQRQLTQQQALNIKNTKKTKKSLQSLTKSPRQSKETEISVGDYAYNIVLKFTKTEKLKQKDRKLMYNVITPLSDAQAPNSLSQLNTLLSALPTKPLLTNNPTTKQCKMIEEGSHKRSNNEPTLKNATSDRQELKSTPSNSTISTTKKETQLATTAEPIATRRKSGRQALKRKLVPIENMNQEIYNQQILHPKRKRKRDKLITETANIHPVANEAKTSKSMSNIAVDGGNEMVNRKSRLKAKLAKTINPEQVESKLSLPESHINVKEELEEQITVFEPKQPIGQKEGTSIVRAVKFMISDKQNNTKSEYQRKFKITKKQMPNKLSNSCNELVISEDLLKSAMMPPLSCEQQEQRQLNIRSKQLSITDEVCIFEKLQKTDMNTRTRTRLLRKRFQTPYKEFQTTASRDNRILTSTPRVSKSDSPLLSTTNPNLQMSTSDKQTEDLSNLPEYDIDALLTELHGEKN